MFSIEGNIGSGKSTLLAHFKRGCTHLGGRPVVFVPEPVDKWENICDAEGTNMIELFYSNQSKYGFAFQIMAFVTRYQLLEATILQNPGAIIITERSLEADRIFASMLHNSGKMSMIEYRIYTQLFDCFNRLESNGIIYLQCSPETAHARYISRNRHGEVIPLEYLRDCHERHERWIPQTALVLHGNGNIDSLDAHVKQIIEYVCLKL